MSKTIRKNYLVWQVLFNNRRMDSWGITHSGTETGITTWQSSLNKILFPACWPVCLSVCRTLAHTRCTFVNWWAAGVFHMQDVVGLNPKPETEHTEWGICYFPQSLYVNSGTLPKIIPLPYPSTSCPIHHSVIAASLDTVPPETLKATKYNTNKTTQNNWICRSQWPRGLRRRSEAVRLLRLWVRIPAGAWMFLCCEFCVLSGRGICDGLITHPEESYRLWCVVVCDL